VTLALTAGNKTLSIGNNVAKAPSFDRVVLNLQ
jgi:hypothetical protein